MSPLLYSHVIDGTGPDLIILHGFLGMSDNWKTLGKRWAAQGYRVHLLDQRNHGRSFWSEDFSYAHMAADLQQYITENQLSNYRIIGHSMGGKTLMYWLGEYQTPISHAVVADIAPKTYEPHHNVILNALASLDFKTLESRQAVEAVLKEQISDPGVRLFLMKNVHRKADKRLGLRLNIEVLRKANAVVSEGLPSHFASSVPTLFLAGAHSDYVLTTDHDSIQKQFSEATIDYIPQASHWLHAEQPDLFFDRVNRFFQS
ncbi:MAG: alpha/beta fold hydrolase [Flavobacteriaceae bacterium]